METTLIIGGARSGKSNYAQQLALEAGGTVLFVATAEAGDEEMRRRIEEHRKQRPASWRTLEAATDIGIQIQGVAGGAKTVLIDCITLLVSNILLKHGGHDGDEVDAARIEAEVLAEINRLIQCIDQVPVSFIMVTNDVGLGLVPANEIGRAYRDLLGRANQVLAGRADKVYLMVAGLPLLIKPAGALYKALSQ